jgi:hypothetical protein
MFVLNLATMKKYNSQALLEELQSDIRQLVLIAKKLKSEDPAVLLEQPAPGKWNVVQVLEHLNSYGRYYLPAIEKSLQKNKPATELFKPGFIGDYFTKMLSPSEKGTVRYKMKAPKDHSPSPHLDHQPVIQTFLSQQQSLLELLEKAKTKNIGRIRTPISISRFIKLKLGDTFRFLIAHEQRHFIQISNTLAQVKKTGTFSPAL